MINIGKKSKDTANTVMGNRLKDFIWIGAKSWLKKKRWIWRCVTNLVSVTGIYKNAERPYSLPCWICLIGLNLTCTFELQTVHYYKYLNIKTLSLISWFLCSLIILLG
jgi:hypothetical protein